MQKASDCFTVWPPEFLSWVLDSCFVGAQVFLESSRGLSHAYCCRMSSEAREGLASSRKVLGSPPPQFLLYDLDKVADLSEVHFLQQQSGNNNKYEVMF